MIHELDNFISENETEVFDYYSSLKIDKAGEWSINENIDFLIKNNDCLGIYLQQISQYPLLSPTEEKKVLEGLLNEDEERKKSEEILYLANQRLVISISKKEFFSRNFDREVHQLIDVINDGNLGLSKAIKRFDPKRETRFSTYATWWVRQAVIRSIEQKGRLIRLPVYMINRIARIKREMDSVRKREGNISFRKLSEKLGYDPDSLKELLYFSETNLSLDQPLKEDEDGAVFGDIIPSPDSEEKLSRFEIRDLYNDFIKIFSHVLTNREFLIFFLRNGCFDGEEWTLEEIGERLGLSRERVRQIQSATLKKIREDTVFMRKLYKYKIENL